ncbi:type VII secretion-associated serine protease mycosin [Nocardia alni]|uniref:type VII secretion-associated serine protease mycosin n=1 Tax=Nocardia alni TaxID=2815723 RepID=UPI0027DF8C1E|nr:type VII secretion-associated serine protease mycosin [Nocardia alni]
MLAGTMVGAIVFRPPPAAALAPPIIDPGQLAVAMAVNAKGGPPDPTQQRSACARPMLSNGPPHDAPTAQQVLNLSAAWQFSRGAGQTVAVIDTGVQRHPRLPGLRPGGDFVSNSDGTADCDGHGTLVAGIIAAQPSPADGFSGVAPDATILSIRQLSLEYESTNYTAANQAGGMSSQGYGTVLTLAAAIVRAVDLGATVINISEEACTPAAANRVDGPLGAAVQYAYGRNVVVVTAAGNVEEDGECTTQNGGSGWTGVGTVASPSWFAPYALSVASTDPDGSPSSFSMHGPWVGVAAPGRDIVSLDSGPGSTGLVDSVQTDQGRAPIDGTSFSCAYVSGLVALVRSRFPSMSAAEVIDRIERTGEHPGMGRDDSVGFGLIDPVAALTAVLPPAPDTANSDVPRAVPPPAPPPRVDPMPRRVAGIGSLLALAAVGLGYAASNRNRRNRSGRDVMFPED